MIHSHLKVNFVLGKKLGYVIYYLNRLISKPYCILLLVSAASQKLNVKHLRRLQSLRGNINTFFLICKYYDKYI